MKFLVTGASGFLGGAICRELVRRGDQVRAFHRSGSNTCLLDDLPLEHALGDLTDPLSIEKATRGVKVIFHCAAQLGGGNDWQRHQAITVLGTRSMLEIARRAGVRRFIHTSSVAALGIPNKRTGALGTPLITENHCGYFDQAHWMYGYAKYLAEMEVQRAVYQGLDAVILNPASVFGPGDLLRRKTSVIHMVAEQGLRFSAPGGMNVVHIQDVVNGHLAGLEYGKTGERYILGGENLTLTHFFRLIREAAGLNSRGIIELPGSMVRIMSQAVSSISRVFNITINPGILSLAGIHFYYDLEKSLRDLHLKVPLNARHTVADTTRWFMEQPI